MKKHLIYTGMFLAAIGFSACNEDFKDWADPQSNPQEESAGQLTATFAAGKDASIIMDATTADSVEIAKLSSTTAEESSKIAVNSLTLNENHTIPFTMTEDNAFKVALSQLDSVTQEAYKSRASVERELKIAINTSAVTPSGKIKISFDAYNYRFTVKDNSAPTELYMTGSAYNWGNPAGDPNAWKELVPVNGTKGAFWGIFHFAANDQVKFAPQANWGNDFGFIDAISQESKDLAGLSDEGGNLKVDVAGWYLVYVSVIGDNKVIEFEKPNVYLMGDTSYDGWNAQLVEQDLFTVPGTADGEFVSPAFLKDGAVRICVNPKAVSAGDWWKTEFIIFDGQIAYRGNGGDQAAVQGKTGQKVYLNFGNGTGRIE